MSELKPVAWMWEYHGHHVTVVKANADALMVAGVELTPIYAIPAGYALVPVEPTDAMLDEIKTDDRYTNRAMRVRYQSMLNAAGAYEIADAQFPKGSVVDEEV